MFVFLLCQHWLFMCFFFFFIMSCLSHSIICSSFYMQPCSAGLGRTAPDLDGVVYRMFLQLIHLSELNSRALCVLTTGHQVCLFVFIPPSIRGPVFLSVRLLLWADFRSDMTHNGPCMSEAFLRFTGFRYREYHRWHHLPSLAFMACLN